MFVKTTVNGIVGTLKETVLAVVYEFGGLLDISRPNVIQELDRGYGRSGNVILGNLGSQKHRLEYAMIGDNVNIGQRLESSAPQQGCMLSAATYELVQDCVNVGELQEIEVKGKSEKVKAYVLEGIQED